MLESPTLEYRYGACAAIAKLKGAASSAAPSLLTTLQHKDLWLRIEAARALNQIGAVSAVPELLKILAREPAKDDPRGMEQRYLLLDNILKKPIAGVDLQMLYAAIRAGLHNQDGRARSEIAPVFSYLKPQQIEPLLPDIYQSIIKLAPSGEMFADGIRLAGLDLLSRLHIREGMALCVSVIELDRWGQGKRLPKCLEYLARYGVHAKEVLPQLREMRTELAKGEKKSKEPSDGVKLLDSKIAAIEASTVSPKLVELKDFKAQP
jgi:hypothetical protein